MNPSHAPVLRAGLLPALCLVVGTSTPAGLAADTPPPPVGSGTAAVSPPKDHTLYLGADFAVQWEGQPRPVQEVQGSSFVVAVNGNRVVVPSRMTDLQIKMEDTLKIAVSSANIANFKAERAYTPGRNPVRKLTESMEMSNLAANELDVALATLRATEAEKGWAGAFQTDGMGNPTPHPLDASDTAAETAALSSSALAQGSGLNSVAEGTLREAQARGEEMFDAFYLYCEVSAPEPLTKPYVVVVTRYRDDPQQAATRIWIYAEALSRVDATPTKVRMFRGGFPPGYKLEAVQVHLYDQRGEIATNLARKRLAITADEAFQFAVVDYIGQHRGATLRPTLVKRPSPAELRARLSAEKRDRTIYVKVGKDGKPTGAFADAACTERLADPDVEAIVRGLRFNPALDKGKAIEAAVPVRLDPSTT